MPDGRVQHSEMGKAAKKSSNNCIISIPLSSIQCQGFKRQYLSTFSPRCQQSAFQSLDERCWCANFGQFCRWRDQGGLHVLSYGYVWTKLNRPPENKRSKHFCSFYNLIRSRFILTLFNVDSSTPRKTGKTDTSKVPELLRQHLKKRHLMEDEIDAEEIEPSALGALSMIDQEENGDRCKTSRTSLVVVQFWHYLLI